MGEPEPCLANRPATVKIQVIRNEFSPVFSENGQYSAKIDETLGNNLRVSSVRANDRDQRVSVSDAYFSLN